MDNFGNINFNLSGAKRFGGDGGSVGDFFCSDIGPTLKSYLKCLFLCLFSVPFGTSKLSLLKSALACGVGTGLFWSNSYPLLVCVL